MTIGLFLNMTHLYLQIPVNILVTDHLCDIHINKYM